jgi:2-methylcitrate dehydratase PrpD
MAAGLAASVGSMCKPFHAGVAAANGLLAARLARRGFGGYRAALEGPQGFLAAHSAATTWIAPGVATSEAWRGRFFIRETLVKRHAACQLAHGSIENMRRIRESAGFAIEDVRRVRLGIAESSVRVCDIAAPRTGLEAKFSIRTLAAMALLGMPTDRLDTFNDALVASPDLVELRGRIAVDGRPDLAVELSVAEIELGNGHVLTAQTDERELDRDLERRRERVCAKFVDLTSARLGRDTTADLQASILGLEDVKSIRPLLRSVGAGTARSVV